MPESSRQFVRFPLDIEARICAPTGERIDAVINEISLGGCFFSNAWVEAAGAAFRLEIRLPNGNWLPINCVRVHTRGGVGARFTDITGFEQNLLAQIIASASGTAGMRGVPDPFAAPSEPADIRIRRKVHSASGAESEEDALAFA